jgi:hypothetical protein
MDYKTIISIFLVIAYVIKHYYEYYQKHLLKKKIKELRDRMQIPYDDYSRYQKAYVGFYKWLTGTNSDKLGYSESTFKLCLKKFEEYFKEK